MPPHATKEKRAKAATEKAAEGSPGGEKKYTEITVEQCIGADELTAAKAKELLGWIEETEDNKFGSDYLFMFNDVRIRCTNNETNRPIYWNFVESYKQDMLNKKWRFNGEPVIVGENGTILNGQHQLLALVIGEHDRTDERYKHHWEEVWGDKEVSIPKLIVYGVPEDDETVNTMDTCKPRSLSDVIYRSKFLKDIKGNGRRRAVKICDVAIKLMWDRTGAVADAWAPRRTHAEAIEFISRHPRLEEAVKHIYEEDSEQKISAYIRPGVAAGMLYLMGTSTSNGEEYHTAERPREDGLNFDMWEKACEFWTLLGSGAKEFKAIREALSALSDPDSGDKGSQDERLGILVKAWNEWTSEDGALTVENLKVGHTVTRDGYRVQSEFPTTGGIDLGKPEVYKADEESVNQKPLREKTLKKPEPNKGKSVEEYLKEIKDKWPDHIVFFDARSGLTVWGKDAKIVGKAIDAKHVPTRENMPCLSFAKESMNTLVEQLNEAGLKIVMCMPTEDNQDFSFQEISPEKKEEEKKKPTVSKNGAATKNGASKKPVTAGKKK